MGYHTVEDGPWPSGVTVAVWPTSSVSGGVPSGPPLDSAVAHVDGTCTFGGLTEGVAYTAFGSGGSQEFIAVNQTAQIAALFAQLQSGPLTPPDNSITSAKLVDGTIVAGDLADNAVTNAKLADNAVTTPELADNAVTNAKLADNAVTGPEIADNVVTAAKLVASAVTADKLTPTTAGYVGISQTGTVRRGKSIIATTESRTNVAYGLLTTPDQVTGVVLPTDGLLCIAYQATWKESVNAAASAAIFLGANQLVHAKAGLPSTSAPAATLGGGTPDRFCPLATTSDGLVSNQNNAAITAYGGDVTTGQILGGGMVGTSVLLDTRWGFCTVFAAAGTYDVSVQFLASSGSVTVQNRKLWVWTLGF